MPPKEIRIVTTAPHQAVKTGVVDHLIYANEVTGAPVAYHTATDPDWSLPFNFILGTKAYQELAAESILPKGRSVKSMRSVIHKHNDSEFMLSYDPGVGGTDHGLAVELETDVMMAHRYATTGTLEPQIGDYEYADSFMDVLITVREHYKKTGKRSLIAVDLETTGLDPYRPGAYIVSVSITRDKGSATIWYNDGAGVKALPPDGLRDLLTSNAVWTVGANFKYDMNWLAEQFGIYCTNFRFDTYLAGSLLDENRNNNLNLHAKLYTTMGGYDDTFNQTHDKAHMENVPKAELLPYAGGDTDACYRIAVMMNGQLKTEKRLNRFYREVLHPANIAFFNMERTGILIDRDYFIELQMELSKRLNDVTEQVRGIVLDKTLNGRKMGFKHGDNFSLTLSSIAKDYLFTDYGLNLKPVMLTPKDEQPSTAKNHLREFEEHPKAGEFVKLWFEYQSIAKTLSTYISGFLVHLRNDGRFHPTYIQFHGKWHDKDNDGTGTVTGRLAAKDPPVQTLPKHTDYSKMLRKGYIAPPGKVIINVDYQQGELRLAACIANEKTMIQAYLNNLDLHNLTASRLTGLSMDDLDVLKQEDPLRYGIIRRSAKAGNFGLIYGMQANGFQIYAKHQYQVLMSMSEVEAFIGGFFELYDGLHPWHDAAIQTARNYSQIVSPLGRIRHLPLIHSKDREVRSRTERQSINSPVQATLSDMVQWALARFYQEYGVTDELQWFLMTHDSGTAYCDEDKVDVWVPRIKELMENLPFEKLGWQPQLTFPVDVEVGYNLADMSEYAA